MKFLEGKTFYTLVVAFGLLGVGGSYYLGIEAMPGGVNDLWGNTPENLKPLYYLTTVLALLGFIITYVFLVFKTDLMSYYPISRSAIVILVASMLWLPYTARMIDDPSTFTWVKIRIALFLVGLGSWFLFRRIMQLHDQGYGIWRKMAVIGSGVFFFHTMIMDAVIWPFLYK